MNQSEKEQLTDYVKAFYRAGTGSPPVWVNVSGANDEAAGVFYEMVGKVNTCSKWVSRVPRPAGGKPSGTWVLTQLGKMGFSTALSGNKISQTCVIQVSNDYGRRLMSYFIGL